MTDSKSDEPTTDEPIEFRMGALLSDIRSNLKDSYSTEVQDEYLAEIKELVEAAQEHARRDAFNLVRGAFKDEQDTDRWTFLQYCLTGAMEGHTFWFCRVKYDIGHEPDRLPKGVVTDPERRAASATIIEVADDDLDAAAIEQILASGKVCDYCGIPLKSDGEAEGFCPLNQKGDNHKPEQAVFEVTHETIELGLARIRTATDVPDTGFGNWEKALTSVPNLGQGLRNEIIRADLTNDASLLDADGYGAILEVALFSEVRYA